MTPARFYKRIFAVLIDFLTGIGLGLLMSHSFGYYFAQRAEVMLRIGAPDSLWRGPIPMLLGVVGPFTYILPLALYLIFLTEPLFNNSLGKQLFKLKITDHLGNSPQSKQKWIRHFIKTSPLWIMILALVLGSWQIALISVMSAFVVLLGSGVFIGSKKLTLHDFLAKTTVLH